MDIGQDSRLNEAVCLALYSSMHAVLQLYRDLLEPWGLTYQQLLVLALLWEDQPRSPGGIADALALDSSSVTGLLNRMERAGLVERSPAGGDRRRVAVRATGRSDALREELAWLEECVARATGLDAESGHALVGRLHDLRTAVTQFPRPASPATV